MSEHDDSHEKTDESWVKGYLEEAVSWTPTGLEWIRQRPPAVQALMVQFPPLSVVRLTCGCVGVVRSWFAEPPCVGLSQAPGDTKRHAIPVAKVVEVFYRGDTTPDFVRRALAARGFNGLAARGSE